MELKRTKVSWSYLDEESSDQSNSRTESQKDLDEGEKLAMGAQEPKKKRERRSKDQSLNRNYKCGCGKMYLSYAALYTHAKVKHEGVFPEGTATLSKKKQGRPKVR